MAAKKRKKLQRNPHLSSSPLQRERTEVRDAKRKNIHIRRSVLRLHAYVPGEQPTKGRFIKLNTNENPYPPSPKVTRALHEADTSRLRLYPDPVCEALRKKIARIHGCKIDQIFVGNGSDEILTLCARAFSEHSGTIGYFEPSYSLYPVLANMEEIRTKPVALTKAFTWAMPKGYQASLFFLTNPNAPTSMMFPKNKIRDFCKRFRGVVVIDEAYADFADEHCMDLASAFDNVLVVRTLSKSYSLAGLRVGYVVGSPTLIDAFYKLKDSYNVSRLAQRLALAALSDTAYMKKTARWVKKTRDRTTRALRKMGFEVQPSDTNFLWVKPSKISAESLFQALRRRKIYIRYFSDKRICEYVRITVGTDRQMNELVRAIAQITG